MPSGVDQVIDFERYSIWIKINKAKYLDRLTKVIILYISEIINKKSRYLSIRKVDYFIKFNKFII